MVGASTNPTLPAWGWKVYATPVAAADQVENPEGGTEGRVGRRALFRCEKRWLPRLTRSYSMRHTLCVTHYVT